MKILFLSAANNPHTVKWVNGLNTRDNEVILVSLKNHQQTEDNINKNIKIVYLPVKGTIGYYLNSYFINTLVKKEKPDIINVHYASGYGTLGRFIKFKNKILNVWGSDVYDFPKENWIKKIILKKNLKAYKIVASTSNCMALETKKYLSSDKNIVITPFGVNIDKFKKYNLYTKDEKYVIGIVKTLKEKYGIKYLIYAIKELKKLLDASIYKKVELRIYGKGELKEQLISLAKELDIEDKVKFMGYISNDKIPDVINEMNIFVVPSILDSESFGVAAVEAMACEIPVIVSDVDGLKEVVINEKTGFIVPRENSKEIALKIQMLLLDKKLCQIIGNNGRKHVIQLYDWEKNLDNIISIYNGLLQKD